MSTGLHIHHLDVVAISNRLHDRHPEAWRALLARAKGEDITLLALIYRRLRDHRDAGAREAFERREVECVVWWRQRERVLEELDAARDAQTTRAQVLEIRPDAISQKVLDGEWCSR